MNAGIVFFLMYLIAVGWAGNAREAADSVSDDVEEFAPFVGAILFLAFLSSTRLKPIVSPFITLAVITTVLKNWQTVRDEVTTTYDLVTGKDV